MEMSQERVEQLRKRFGGPMSAEEIGFLEDLRGLIDSAIRNGLSFSLILSILVHDLDWIARSGFSLEAAKEKGFHPKVTGYSKYGENAVGEPEEPAE